MFLEDGSVSITFSPYEKKAGYIGISGRRPFIPAVAVCVLQMAPPLGSAGRGSYFFDLPGGRKFRIR